jgi:hypothetical protein
MDWYFDIETAKLDPHDTNRKANLEPETGKIITIQLQLVDEVSCEPIGPLNILKEWEPGCSERTILEQVKPLITGNHWDFVMLGYNLSFEYKFLSAKFRQYFNLELSAKDWLERPLKDMKLIGIILNDGSFKGASLSSFTSKPQDGAMVPLWYERGEYDLILEYVEREAESFLKAWKEVNFELRKKFQK